MFPTKEWTMKHMLIAATAVALGAIAAPSAVLAQDNQPGEGETSTGRNDEGFGGGPHCHLLAVEQADGHFTFVRVFPSHTGHAHSGGSDGPLVADADCDGLP
jgi:hypothetical protein